MFPLWLTSISSLAPRNCPVRSVAVMAHVRFLRLLPDAAACARAYCPAVRLPADETPAACEPGSLPPAAAPLPPSAAGPFGPASAPEPLLDVDVSDVEMVSTFPKMIVPALLTTSTYPIRQVMEHLPFSFNIRYGYESACICALAVARDTNASFSPVPAGLMPAVPDRADFWPQTETFSRFVSFNRYISA